MTVTACPPPKRTRNVVECELTAAHGRVKTLRMAPEFIDDDSTPRRVHDWYSRRAAFLERELDDLNRRGV